MKHFLYSLLTTITSLLLLTGCADARTDISLSDDGILVNGAAISSDSSSDVYAANDIVFYLEGQDFTYGEGSPDDSHSQAEADAHTVVHITAPGTYHISGQLSAGQIAVDLGDEAEDDPDAVVNLVLNNADITCTVAPAIIFYNVYECGDSDAENASLTVDTSKAGANVILADGSNNTINGSYVARIYKSYELSEDGSEVIDSEKLHKYDGAFYSKMSMNISGEDKGSGVLNINAENEGLDSELHLTLNGGTVNITSGNDGINTNEDGISVTTVNGGTLNILVSGETGEGDGIDSNGWLVINGGTVTAQACSSSLDAGIDSDMGIHLNGGNILATGNMLDRISESDQNYVVFQFTGSQKGNNTYTLKDASQNPVAQYTPQNDFSCLILSSQQLTEGTYTLWNGNTQLSVAEQTMSGGQGGPMPGGMQPPEGMEMPENMEFPEGKFPEGERPEMPEGMEMPENMEFPEDKFPEGERPEGDSVMNLVTGTQPQFELKNGGNYYMVP